MVRSTITEEVMEKIRAEFRIPSEYITRVPGDEEEPRCGEREIVISIAHMIHGLRFPPSDFLINFFNFYELCPTQLSPNSFALLSAFAWCCEVGCDEFPTMLGVKRLFLIQKGVSNSTDGFGDYHLQTRLKTTFLDTAVIDSALKDWKHLWFYIQIPQDINIPIRRLTIDTKAKNTLTAGEKSAIDNGFQIIRVARSLGLTAAILYEAYEARIPPLRRREDKGFGSEAKPQDKDADDLTLSSTWITRMKKFSERMHNQKMREMRRSGQLDVSKAADLPDVPTRRGSRGRRAPVVPLDGSGASTSPAAVSSGQDVPGASDAVVPTPTVQQSSAEQTSAGSVPVQPDTSAGSVPVQPDTSLLSNLPVSIPIPPTGSSSGSQAPGVSAPSVTTDPMLTAVTRSETQPLPPSVSPQPQLGQRRKSVRKLSDNLPIPDTVSQALAAASGNLGKRPIPDSSVPAQPPKKSKRDKKTHDLRVSDPQTTNVPPSTSVPVLPVAARSGLQAPATSSPQTAASPPVSTDWWGSGSRITQIPNVDFDEIMTCNVKYGYLPSDQESALRAVTGLLPPRAVEECRNMSTQEAFGLFCMHILQGQAAAAGIQLRQLRTLNLLTDAREENKKLLEENRKLKASSDLEKKLKEAEESLAALRKNREEDQKRYSDELEEEKQKLSELQSRAEKVRAELDAERVKHAEEKKVLDGQIQDLNKEKETLSGLLEAATTATAEIEDARKDLEKQRDEAVKEKSYLSLLLQNLNEVIEDLVSRFPQAEMAEADLDVYWQRISDVRGVAIIKKIWKALEGQKNLIIQKNKEIVNLEKKVEEAKVLQSEEYGDGILSVLPKIWALFESLKKNHGFVDDDFPPWEWFIEAQVQGDSMPDNLKQDLTKKVRDICAKSLESDSEEDQDPDDNQTLAVALGISDPSGSGVQSLPPPAQVPDPQTATATPTSTGNTSTVPASENITSGSKSSVSNVLSQSLPTPFSQTVNQALGQVKKEKVDERDYNTSISTRPSSEVVRIDEDDDDQ